MEKKFFIDQVSKRLDEINVPYQIGKQADIIISATFKRKQEQKENDSALFYFAFLFLNQENNTVFVYEKIMDGDVELSEEQDYSHIFVHTKADDPDAIIPLSYISKMISAIASGCGFKYEKTNDMKTASFPPVHTPVFIEKEDNSKTEVKPEQVCPKCKTVLLNPKNNCPVCGISLRQPTTLQQKKKLHSLGIILISVLIVGVMVSIGFILQNVFRDKKTESETSINEETSTNAKNSAIVSLGVRSSDLGNILNGQYYFATDKYVFYSCFDENDKAHIYSVKKDGTDLKPIFDGFGWSLVVIDDWLYFSGNQGTAIDGSYHLFRMKLDGSQVEKINDKYSYGMLLYGDYLYYVQSSSTSEGTMSINRSSLNGENKQMLFPNGLSPLVYKDKLYYYDNQGNMYRTKPDGTEPQVLLTGVVKTYVLSGEKIVYNDNNHNIYICDLDGKNNTLIRSSTGKPLNNVNAYNGRVFFSEYDTDFNYTLYGYEYTIKSCKMDGSDEKTVFSSVSYGIYMNLVNNKLMLLDYVMNPESSVMVAIIKVMDLNGDNQKLMDR